MIVFFRVLSWSNSLCASNILTRTSNRICLIRSITGNLNRSTFQKQTNKSNVVPSSVGEKELSKHVKVTERIKQTSKDVSYLSVIVVGIGITCFVFYVIFSELFSSKSPSSVFATALDKCKQDYRVVDALGEPLKGHGEMTKRRRARHVSSVEYENGGQTYLRVKFYLKGSKGTATVQCETNKRSGKSQFRYIFVEMDTYPHQVIVVEDNRLLEQQV